ncbi:hypothetical protein DERP_009531 [Dermatophagoides pteronyssinus]|uniref:Uncharacterized protein n=1 Tax=Dermatophagoides pteronyssinus TaxID=6956 RepID=A0ABQ8IUE9_DERPT|nr:hypothetical protein DERP_009531 [Dermatophagoides pteronyssinus]
MIAIERSVCIDISLHKYWQSTTANQKKKHQQVAKLRQNVIATKLTKTNKQNQFGLPPFSIDGDI